MVFPELHVFRRYVLFCRGSSQFAADLPFSTERHKTRGNLVLVQKSFGSLQHSQGFAEVLRP